MPCPGTLSPIGIQVGQQAAKLGVVAQQFAPGLDQAVHLLVFEVETGGDLIEIFKPLGIVDIFEVKQDEIGRDGCFRSRDCLRPAIDGQPHQFDGRRVVAMQLHIGHDANGLFDRRGLVAQVHVGIAFGGGIHRINGVRLD